MARTELAGGRVIPSWQEFSSQGAAFAFNVVSIISPSVITNTLAAEMSLVAATFTGLEVADTTTQETHKKVAAVMQGVGVVMANRGLAMVSVGVATAEDKLWIPGIVAFQAGAILAAAGIFVEKGA